MTEVATWQNNDDNVIVQTGALPEMESLMTLAESTVKSIRQHIEMTRCITCSNMIIA